MKIIESNLFATSTIEGFRIRFTSESITVAQLAMITNEHEGTIRNALSAGKYPIPSFKVGSKRLFLLLDVAAYVDACREVAATQAVATRQAKASRKSLNIPRQPGRPTKAEQMARQALISGKVIG